MLALANAEVSAEACIGEADEADEEDEGEAIRDDEDERNTGGEQRLESLDSLCHIGPQVRNALL
jgi:hypothetical protein